jgi:hypothetical protein
MFFVLCTPLPVAQALRLTAECSLALSRAESLQAQLSSLQASLQDLEAARNADVTRLEAEVEVARAAAAAAASQPLAPTPAATRPASVQTEVEQHAGAMEGYVPAVIACSC